MTTFEIGMVRPLIEANVDVDPVTGCWLWTGPLNGTGYGSFLGVGVHRMAYVAWIGPIPPGHVIDHVCRTRRCVCPNIGGVHLEPVTAVENTRRAVAYVQQFPGERVHHGAKRWCVRGHPFDDTNTGRDSQHKRYCKKCRRTSLSEYRATIQQPRGWEWHIDEVRYEQLATECQPVDGEPILTTDDVAIRFGMRRNTLTHWCRRHPELMPVHERGKPRQWPESHVRRLEASWTNTPWNRSKPSTE